MRRTALAGSVRRDQGATVCPQPGRDDGCHPRILDASGALTRGAMREGGLAMPPRAPAAEQQQR